MLSHITNFVILMYRIYFIQKGLKRFILYSINILYSRGGQPAARVPHEARDIPQCGPQSLKMRMIICTVESQNYDHIATTRMINNSNNK